MTLTKGICFCWLLLCSVYCVAQPNADEEDDSAKPDLLTTTILEESIQCIDCFDYEVVGVCFWLSCVLWDCEVETSLKVKHYIPDLVVSSYTSDSAWSDTRDWNDEAPGGMSRTESPNDWDTYLDWKSVDIITHPALLVYNELGEEELFCQSQQDTPFLPLYLSGVDPFWSMSWLERALQLVRMDFDYIKTDGGGSSGSSAPKEYKQGQVPWDAIPEGSEYWWSINSNGEMVLIVNEPEGGEDNSVSMDGLMDGYWAPVYPRCGWGAHPYDPINGAVAAHRAADIVTREEEPHVYWPTDGDCDHKCWKPGPVEEHNDDNRFQLLFPEVEDNARPFGGSPTWANGKNITHQTYTWSLWRKYMCCEPEGQVFLFDIDTSDSDTGSAE